MEIEKNDIGDVLELRFKGRLDTGTAPQLEQLVKEDFEGKKKVVLDFAALDYLSSAGLRVLLLAQKLMNRQRGKMCIRHVNENIMEVFDMTGFADILTIET